MADIGIKFFDNTIKSIGKTGSQLLEVDVTTIVDNQEMVEIELYYIESIKAGVKSEIGVILVKGLPACKAGEPRIRLKIQCTEAFDFAIKIVVDDKPEIALEISRDRWQQPDAGHAIKGIPENNVSAVNIPVVLFSHKKDEGESESIQQYIPDKLAAEKLSTDKLQVERLSAGRLPADKTPADNLQTDKLSAGKLPVDKMLTGKLAAEKMSADKLQAGKPSTYKLPAEKLSTDKLQVERLPAGRLPADKTSVDNLQTDKLSAGKLPVDKMLTGKLAAEKMSADKLQAGKPFTYKLPAEKLSTDKLQAERLPADELPVTEKKAAKRIIAVIVVTAAIAAVILILYNLYPYIKTSPAGAVSPVPVITTAPSLMHEGTRTADATEVTAVDIQPAATEETPERTITLTEAQITTTVNPVEENITLLAGRLLEILPVYFYPDSLELLPGSPAKVEALAALLGEYRGKVFLDITGHAAESGTLLGQMSISLNRARRIRDELVKRNAITSNLCRVEGKGIAEPVYTGDDPAQMYQNRRVEIAVREARQE